MTIINDAITAIGNNEEGKRGGKKGTRKKITTQGGKKEREASKLS
jgi:hypothetical protein